MYQCKFCGCGTAVGNIIETTVESTLLVEYFCEDEACKAKAAAECNSEGRRNE